MNIIQRKPTRLPNYDYSTPNYYFITVCTHEKRCIFGKAGTINRFGKIVKSCIEKISEVFSNVHVDKYVIMPNHIHIILVLRSENNNEILPNISTVVGQFKTAVTKSIRNIEQNRIVWQRSFYDHIIRNQMEYESIWNYIEGNPSKWMEDKLYVEYDPVWEGQ